MIVDNCIVFYVGVLGIYGLFLFFCVLVIILGVGDDVLFLAVRLISRGASVNVECERLGRYVCCGKFFILLNVCCVVFEFSILYEMEYE